MSCPEVVGGDFGGSVVVEGGEPGPGVNVLPLPLCPPSPRRGGWDRDDHHLSSTDETKVQIEETLDS